MRPGPCMRHGGRRTLTHATRTGEGPQWSADGQRIVFQDGPALAKRFGEATPPELRDRSRAMRWVSVRPDGTALRPEPPPPDVGEGPVSPDGRWRAAARTPRESW